jgi:hypothetical protein
VASAAGGAAWGRLEIAPANSVRRKKARRLRPDKRSEVLPPVGASEAREIRCGFIGW